MVKRSTAPRDIGLLKQLYDDGQLLLAEEFQRNSVWPRPAKSYLIDTILHDRPIPLLFFERTANAQTGRANYTVIDGQQRLRAIFEFLDDEYPLRVDEQRSQHHGKFFSQLPAAIRSHILNYTLTIEDLIGYSNKDIRDMFVRMNRYVVKLSRQELRHAKEDGKFKDFVEDLGSWPFWGEYRVFTELQLARFRAVEFASELVILLQEGPQDKKTSIDLYYGQYRGRVPFRTQAQRMLSRYIEWIIEAVPNLAQSHYRRPTHLYALVGAIDSVSEEGDVLSDMSPDDASEALARFEIRFRSADAKGEESRYAAAAARQTDNVIPRITRIDILSKLLVGACF